MISVEGVVLCLNKRIQKKKGRALLGKASLNPLVITHKSKSPIIKTDVSKRYMYKPRFMLAGMYWYFHANDVDNWPSRPHGDEYNGRFKLDVYSGEIYNRNTRKVVDKLSKKEKERLWKDRGFLKILSRYK